LDPYDGTGNGPVEQEYLKHDILKIIRKYFEKG
jgi:septum formation topological specificity factor MinE